MSHPHSIISFYYMQGQGIPYPGSFSALLQYEKAAIDIFLLHTLVYKRRQNSDALLYLIFFYIISYVFPVPLSFLYSSYSFSIQAFFSAFFLFFLDTEAFLTLHPNVPSDLPMSDILHENTPEAPAFQAVIFPFHPDILSYLNSLYFSQKHMM